MFATEALFFNRYNEMEQVVPGNEYARTQLRARRAPWNLPTNGMPSGPTQRGPWSLVETIAAGGQPFRTPGFTVEKDIRRSNGSYLQRSTRNDEESNSTRAMRKNWKAKEIANREWEELMVPRDQVIDTFSEEHPNGLTLHNAEPQRVYGTLPFEMYPDVFRDRNALKMDRGVTQQFVDTHMWNYKDVPLAPLAKAPVTLEPESGAGDAINESQFYNANSYEAVQDKPPVLNTNRFNADPEVVNRELNNVNEGCYGTMRSMDNVQYNYWASERTKPPNVADTANTILWQGGDRPFGRSQTQSLLMEGRNPYDATDTSIKRRWYGNGGLDAGYYNVKSGQNLEQDLDLQIKKPLPARNIRLTSSMDIGETFAGEGLLPTPGVSAVQRGNDLPGEGEVQIDSGLTNLSLGRFEYYYPQEDGIGRKGRTPGMGDNVYSARGMQTKMNQSALSRDGKAAADEEWTDPTQGTGPRALWNKGQNPVDDFNYLLTNTTMPSRRDKTIISR